MLLNILPLACSQGGLAKFISTGDGASIINKEVIYPIVFRVKLTTLITADNMGNGCNEGVENIYSINTLDNKKFNIVLKRTSGSNVNRLEMTQVLYIAFGLS